MDQGSGDRSDKTTAPGADAKADAQTNTQSGRTPRIGKAQLLAACALIAFVLHTLAVLWTWFAWSNNPGSRGWWLVFTDLPVSFLYGHVTHGALLVWSLLLGGLQWALTGALVALAAWHFSAFRKRRA